MADENYGNLMVVVFDANPICWGDIAARQSDELTMTRCLEGIMAFCNAHLMMGHKNSLAFVVSHTEKSKFIFPNVEKQNDSLKEKEQFGDLPADGKYEQFAVMNDSIIEELRNLIGQIEITDSQQQFSSPSLLAGAFAMALCYIHRAEKECAVGMRLKSRIMVVKVSPDVSSQYMPIMNCIFAAQKNNVVIDACILHEHSGFLQQAADITGGSYLQVPHSHGLLQYLLWIFLPEPSMREMLALPSSMHIDYRAACFCHRKLVDIGFVCSVCLSIYCHFIPRCLTCQTRFKLPALPMAKPKKKKKT